MEQSGFVKNSSLAVTPLVRNEVLSPTVSAPKETPRSFSEK